jgi:hypothetical protein
VNWWHSPAVAAPGWLEGEGGGERDIPLCLELKRFYLIFKLKST